MADAGLLTLFGCALYLWLRHVEMRLAHMARGFTCQLQSLGATVTRRSSSARELLILARGTPFGTPHVLLALERAQRNADEAVTMLAQNATDPRAWSTFEQASARLGASREVLEEDLAVAGVIEKNPLVGTLLLDLCRLDQLLYDQSQTAHALALCYALRRRSALGRVTGVLAGLRLVPRSATGVS